MEQMSATQENGLKYQVARQRDMKLNVEAKYAVASAEIFKNWNMLKTLKIPKKDLDEMIWKYVDSQKFWQTCESALVGELSRIDNYTNKRGKVSRAHFSKWGKYLKKAENENPSSYEGNFPITQDLWKYTLTGEDCVFSPKLEC